MGLKLVVLPGAASQQFAVAPVVVKNVKQPKVQTDVAAATGEGRRSAAATRASRNAVDDAAAARSDVL